MFKLLSLISGRNRSLRARIITIYTLLIGGTILAWVWALVAFRDYPVLMGTALLAYTFGLRHAVDADHIAAIDNVTRKLMQDGQTPVGVGFFFAVGHSTVVFLASAAIAATTAVLQSRFESFKEVGGVIGTSVSAAFLLAIAAMNLVIAYSVYRTFKHVLAGGAYVEEDLNVLLNSRGFLARILRPVFRFIGHSWQMLPLGFLFGLGFETATEVSLLGISAEQASQGLSVWSIMIFPILFAAGMSLLDTTDGILMLGAYGWAFVKPIRKLYYNMTITLVSALVALVIGGIEALGLLSEELNLEGGIWDYVATLNESFGGLGFIIIGIFALSWLASIAFYRFKRFDELEVAQAES